LFQYIFNLVVAKITFGLKFAHKNSDFLVSGAIANREVVIKGLGPWLPAIQGISGACILTDGSVAPVLDMPRLMRGVDLHGGGGRSRATGRERPPEAPRPPRVLVVDDSITVREVERKLLGDKGYAVDTASDGLEAWGCIRQNKYDLVITDIDMPNMDGIELVVQIRDSQEYEHLPVIIVSYKDREIDKTRGLEAGADYYLTKGSFDDQTFLTAVEDLIGPPQ